MSTLQYKHAVYVQTCKLFADLERLRQERETKEAHEKYDDLLCCLCLNLIMIRLSVMFIDAELIQKVMLIIILLLSVLKALPIQLGSNI